MMEPLLPARSPAKELALRALLAYDMARVDCIPETEGFMDEGIPYSSRETFVSDLLDNLALLLGDYARAAGVPVPGTHDQDRLERLVEDYQRRRLLGVVA